MADAVVPVPPEVGDPIALARLIRAFDGHARYIGGWVRDTLLGHLPVDLDVATPLPPEIARDRAEAAGLAVWSSASGLAHGTIGVVVGGRTIEVTTLRRDVSTDGRHAVVAFTDDWREDAARRDFTINALSADPATGRVHDYFGGLADLAAGRVRFIGDPAQRIAEDHLRILRFFRFHARFGGGPPDAAGYAACVADTKALMALSRERIAGEFLKLLALPDPAATVVLMIRGGILAPVLPEIETAEALAPLITAERAAALPPAPLRRLAALLPRDPETASAVAARLRLSKADRLRLERDAEPIGDGDARAAAYRLDPPSTIDRLLLEGRVEDAGAIAAWSPPRLPLTGGALIARGLPAGPAVARTLARIEAAWIAAGFPRDQALDAIVDAVLADQPREAR